MKKNQKNKKSSIIWNTIGTTLNAFTSLFFMIIVTRINGEDNAGIFSFAFSTACLLFILGVYCGRVYQVTDCDKKNDDISYLNVHFITCILMIIIALVFSLVRGYTLLKLITILLLTTVKALEAISDTYHAIIQKQNSLEKVGISLTIRSTVGVILFCIVDLITKNMILAIISLVIIDIIILISYDIKKANINLLKNYSFNRKIIIKIMKESFLVFIFTFLNLFLISISKYAIDFYSTDRMQTIFGIIIMPATVISLVAQFIIHPFLLEIKENIVKKTYDKLSLLILKLNVLVIVFTIIALIGTWLIGIPVLNIIYGIKLDSYKIDLIIILVGAMFYAMTTILSNVLTTFRTIISQTIAYFIATLISTVVSFYLVKRSNIQGASWSYLLSMCLIFVLFLILTYKTIKKRRVKNEYTLYIK